VNPWWLYLISSFAFLGLLSYLGYKVLGEKWLIYLLLLMLIILLIPAAVPETPALAPAWFIIMFELVFGETEHAIQAAKPLVLVLILLHAGLLASHFVTRRIAQS